MQAGKLKKTLPIQRQLQSYKKKLYFKPNVDSNDEDEGKYHLLLNFSIIFFN